MESDQIDNSIAGFSISGQKKKRKGMGKQKSLGLVPGKRRKDVELSRTTCHFGNGTDLASTRSHSEPHGTSIDRLITLQPQWHRWLRPVSSPRSRAEFPSGVSDRSRGPLLPKKSSSFRGVKFLLGIGASDASVVRSPPDPRPPNPMLPRRTSTMSSSNSRVT